MKHKSVKWERPTTRVTRTCQILGPITEFKQQCAIQKNDLAMKKFKQLNHKHYQNIHNRSKVSIKKLLVLMASESELIFSPYVSQMSLYK